MPYKHAQWAINGATFWPENSGNSNRGTFNNWRRIHGSSTPIPVNMLQSKASISIVMPSYNTFTEATDYKYLQIVITPCDPCGDFNVDFDSSRGWTGEVCTSVWYVNRLLPRTHARICIHASTHVCSRRRTHMRARPPRPTCTFNHMSFHADIPLQLQTYTLIQSMQYEIKMNNVAVQGTSTS